MVRVPGPDPPSNVLVYRVEKKEMEQPYVRGAVGLQAMVGLQYHEECLPFQPKTFRHIIPNPLDPSVVYAPVMNGMLTSNGCKNECRTHLPQMYEPLSAPRLSIIQAATAMFSVPWSPRQRLGHPWELTALRKSFKTVVARLLLCARMPVTNLDLPSMNPWMTIFQRISPA